MSRRKIVLCADIGTSSLKAGFVDIGAASTARRRLLAFVREPYPAEISPALVEGRHVKLPCGEWERAFQRALATLFRQRPGARIETICVSGNGPTLVPIQKDGLSELPLYWFGATEPAEGRGLQSFFLPHVRWFMRKYPQQYERTAAFCSCQEWLAGRLGAAPHTTLPTPAHRPYYWDAAQCRAAGVDEAKFLPFAPLGSVVGRSTAEAEELFGLRKGIPIVAGGPDFIMALLGTATVKPGLVCDRAGSSEGINVCVAGERGRGGLPTQLRAMPHPIEGLWNVSVVLPESGSVFERWRQDKGHAGTGYEELLSKLIPPSANLDEIHPVLSGIAGQVKGAVETLRGAGFPVKEMRLSGGQAKSPRWNALKARVSRCRLLVPEILDGELAGGAAAAMFALGHASTLAEACRALVVIKERY